MRVLAGFGVPVGRYDGRKLRVYLLLGNGEYIDTVRSECCPLFPIAEIHRSLPLQSEMDDDAVVWAFDEWMMKQGIFCRNKWE